MAKDRSDISALAHEINRIGNQELSAKLISLASTDTEFRKRLIADPKSTISSLVGVPLPEEININVIEETPSNFTLVLPATKSLLDRDLSAEAEHPDKGWKNT